MSRNLPTLSDLKEQIPPGGLLNPGLRQRPVGINYGAIERSCPGPRLGGRRRYLRRGPASLS